MTPLTFRRQDSYGKERWYPVSPPAQAVVALTGRVCLKPEELDALERYGGFPIVREPANPTRATDNAAAKRQGGAR